MLTQIDEISYLAELIKAKELAVGNKKTLIKGLILVGSGIKPNGILIKEVPLYDDVLVDWIENFRQLYPQYFNAVHPAFTWMSGIVFQEFSG